MRNICILFVSTLFIVSCQPSKKDMLSKKWKAIGVENPQLDAEMRQQEIFLDTFGKHADAATNEMIYGIKNIDSARASLQAQLKDMKAMQQHAVATTSFDFRKNGTVIMNFSGQSDSTKWYFEKEGKLVLDEPKLKGTGATIKMDVVLLTDKELKLKFNKDGMESTVTFQPDTK